MSNVKLDVYLYFRGQCQEAMEFYKNIFGGELETSPYANIPGGVPGISDDPTKQDWLMHAKLDGGDITLMGSDTVQASEQSAKVELALGGSDEARLRDIFGKLSEGGTVRSDLKKEAWGDIFGALTDKYNITWMVNITTSDPGVV